MKLATKCIYQKLARALLVGTLTGLWLSVSIVAAKAYDEEEAPPSARSSGSRGCATEFASQPTTVPGIILLVPDRKVSKTISPRPTFAWFVRDASNRPIEFRLYESRNNDFKLLKEIKGENFKTRPGIMVLSPQDIPELSPQKRYRWQVEIICNPSRPSSNIFAEAEIQVVPISPELKNQIDSTSDPLKQAQLYAGANLWYDSLARVLTFAGNSPSIENFRLSLFRKIATNNREEQLFKYSSIFPVNLGIN
jgi:Domain of Unknown Function (DUF928)